MAGIHKYSSSLFIQSGSIAKFKNGITASSLNIEGSVTADKYLLSDGTEVIGGEQKVFFAGAPGDATLGISRSAANGGPESKDIFIGVDASNADPTDADKIAIGGIIIQTTGSTTFQPNFFNFIKLGDDPSIVAQGLAGSTTFATTVQQGGLNSSSYVPTSEAERQTGVHRYIIFAAETGSGGETHQVFHTVTLDAFSNIPPTIVPPPITAVTLSMAHNEDSGALVLHFTKSFDQNQIDDGDTADFLTEFSVTRNSSNPNLNNFFDTSDAFSLSLNHDDNPSPAQFITITDNVSPGLSSSAGAPKLHFTASITNYTVDISNHNTIFYSITQNQNFNITLKDTNSTLTLNPGATNQIISMAVVPPPTASISDIKVEFEGSDNSGGFTNIPSTTHTHTLLYDTVTTLDTPTILELDDRYTSSLVRMKVTADITPPSDFIGDDSYQTRIQIHEADSGNINENDPNFKTFKFTRNHPTASHVGNNLNNVSTDFAGELNASNTESNGFTSFEITPTFVEGATTDQLFYGSPNEDFTSANRTDEVKHGDHNHFVVTDLPNASTLNIIKCPDILVKNPKVEIQRGSKYSVNDEGLSAINAIILYGLSSSLLSSQTQSHIIDPLGVDANNHPQLDNYISESIIKLRVLADIIEPFGPDHKEITATLTDNNTHTATLNLHTGSNADVLSADFGYTTDHGYSNNGIDFSGKELLVSSYTSSWVEFNFDQGSYTFTATFTRTDGVTNRAGITADNTITADLNLGGTPTTEIVNLNHKTETFG